ncbi:MAG: phage regulatory CII family protein [Desulfobacterales bacterium]
MNMQVRDEIRAASEKAKSLLKLTVDSYPRKAVVSDLSSYELEDKAYSTLSNELIGADVGANGPAKMGLATAIHIIGLCGLNGSSPEARQWACAMVDVMDRLLGRVAIEIPTVQAPQFATLMDKFGRLSMEVGEALRAFGESIQDGRISRCEADVLLKELEDVHRVTASLEDLIRREMVQK